MPVLCVLLLCVYCTVRAPRARRGWRSRPCEVDKNPTLRCLDVKTRPYEVETHTKRYLIMGSIYWESAAAATAAAIVHNAHRHSKTTAGAPLRHTRAEQSKRTHRSTSRATTSRRPPRPRYQMKGLNGLCTGLCDMCTDSESSPRNGLPKSDKQVRISQALRDATSRPLCGRPERATTGLNSQVCCGDGVGSARRAERPCASRVRNLNFTHTGPPVSH